MDVLAAPESGTAEAGVLYDYNVLGQRISRKEVSGTTTNTEYYIHGGVNIVADLDEDKELLRSYSYAPGYDNIISMTSYGDETNTYFYIRNHNNSVVALVDKDGDIAESYTYTAYGEVTVFDANGNELDESALGNRYTFQGREIDWSTGLYNFRARYYDPETGRWLSKDPIGINGGLNQYVFCGNNPVMFGDPCGLFTAAIGGQAIIQLIPAVGADGGYAIAHRKGAGWTHGWTHGPVGSLNPGGGTPSGSAGLFFQWTTGNSVNDLKGLGFQGGVGYDFGPAVGVDYVAGFNMSGPESFLKKPLSYQGFQINIGAGLAGLAGEMHALLTFTIAKAFGKDEENMGHKIEYKFEDKIGDKK